MHLASGFSLWILTFCVSIDLAVLPEPNFENVPKSISLEDVDCSIRSKYLLPLLAWKRPSFDENEGNFKFSAGLF